MARISRTLIHIVNYARGAYSLKNTVLPRGKEDLPGPKAVFPEPDAKSSGKVKQVTATEEPHKTPEPEQSYMRLVMNDVEIDCAYSVHGHRGRSCNCEISPPPHTHTLYDSQISYRGH